MRFLSNPKQLRFIISRNGDKAKTVLKTSYDIVSLPYLLTYVMGLFFEEYANEGVGFSTSELTNMLLTMYPKDFAVSAEQADLVIDDLETWERNCSSYDTIRTIRIFKPKELNLSEKLFCKLKKHFKQNGFHAVYAETNEESLIIFYRPQSNQRVFGYNRLRQQVYSRRAGQRGVGGGRILLGRASRIPPVYPTRGVQRHGGTRGAAKRQPCADSQMAAGAQHRGYI